MITDFRQVDEAMKSKLEGCKLIRNGIEFTVPVVYIDPEKEFRKVIPGEDLSNCELDENNQVIFNQGDYYAYTQPTIAFYRAGIFPDNERWDNNTLYDNPEYDNTNSLIGMTGRRAPDPYLIYYGIIFYYDFQQEGVLINRHIINSLRRGAFLTIEGDSYDVFFLSYRNPNTTYKDFGDMQEKEVRLFSEQYLFKVEGELDLGVRKPKKVVRILNRKFSIK